MSVKYHKITQFPDGFHTRPENQANDFEKVYPNWKQGGEPVAWLFYKHNRGFDFVTAKRKSSGIPKTNPAVSQSEI